MNLLRNKFLCPIISSLITITITFLICFVVVYPLYERNKFDRSIEIDNITNLVDSKLKFCGQDYWITWIVIDSTKKNFRFQDVRGLNAGTIISPKALQLNAYYLSSEIPIDNVTYKFLDNFRTGAVGYYPDLSFFKDKKTAKEIIDHSNKKIYQVGISVTKSKFNNLVYVFVMSVTKSNLRKCDRNKIVHDLEELSIYAKGAL